MVEVYYGNSKELYFTRKDIDGETIWDVPPEMIFTVRRKYAGNIVFKKLLTGGDFAQEADGSWHLCINPQDTRNISAPSKREVCVCDVRVYDADGNEYTIIKPDDFVILPVATE